MSLHKTRGIVLHQTKYADSGLILKIYTEAFGLQSYIIRGCRSKKSPFKPALLQNMNLLEMVAYHKEKNKLQSLKEVKMAYTYQALHFDMVKQSIAFFINEVIYKSIKEEEKNLDLFEFLFHAMQYLDQQNENISLFPHIFCVQFSRYLGFFPKNNYDNKSRFFFPEEGLFREIYFQSKYLLDEKQSAYFILLMQTKLSDVGKVRIPKTDRKDLLNHILNFYLMHLQGIKEFKSVDILSEILS